MTRYRWALPAALLLLPGLGPAGGAAAQSATSPSQSSLMRQGKTVFDQNCAGCHQHDGSGVPGTFPPLAGNQNLDSTRLVVETIGHGHSGTITVAGVQYNSTMPPIGSGFSAQQTAAVATYVRNSWGNGFGAVSPARVDSILGPRGAGAASGQGGPSSGGAPADTSSPAAAPGPAPGAEPVPLASLGPLQKGGRLFRLNCAPCHGATAHGGALVYTDKDAPDLMDVNRAEIPDIVRKGPGPMPAFPPEVFADSDVAAIADYVIALQTPAHPGGFGLGFFGPVTEGFIAVVCGLGAAVLAAVWIEWKGRG